MSGPVKSLYHLNTKETLFLWSSESTQATKEANFKSILRSIDCMPVKHAKHYEKQAIILMKSVFMQLSISKPYGINWDVTCLDQELESCKSAKVLIVKSISSDSVCAAFFRAVQELSRKLEVNFSRNTFYTQTHTQKQIQHFYRVLHTWPAGGLFVFFCKMNWSPPFFKVQSHNISFLRQGKWYFSFTLDFINWWAVLYFRFL